MPLHPQFVHFPLALSVIIPLLAVAIMVMIKQKAFSPMVWGLVIGLQVLTTATGYLSMNLGESEEDVVEKVVEKKHISEHEEKAEVFVAFSVAATVVAILVLFLKAELQLYFMMLSFVIMLAQCFTAYRTGESGGELVYVHKAANAYKLDEVESQGLLPTPGVNTSESALPVDDQDYGKSETEESEDEEDKDE
ncbi:MAG: hypothetical protein K2P81_01875 [Bacteriovoracaceae bacterium]|nr:hypothetical protein [Bacteriovoracaceae bacterium]